MSTAESTDILESTSAHPTYEEYKDSGVDWLGEVPSPWKVAKLKYCVQSIVSGGTPASTKDKYWVSDDEKGTPWVAVGDMSETSRVDTTEKRVTKEGVQEADLETLSEGTLLYSIYASLGEVSILDIPATTNQAILGITPDREMVSREFLYYWLKHMQKHVQVLSSSNTQDNLSAGRVRNMPVYLPDLSEQRAIAAFLDRETERIDALIEKKEQLIDLLEEKRTALISRVVTKGLDADVEMQDSGVEWLGEIPAGWDLIKLRWLTENIEQGWSPSADDREAAKDEWGVITLSAVKNGDFYPEEHKALPSDTDPKPKYEIQPGDFLLTRANTPELVGDACLVRDTRGKLMMSDLVYRLRLRNDLVDGQYLMYWMISRSGRHQVERSARGSSKSMVKISQGHIKSWIAALPPLAEQRRIVDHLDRQTAQIDTLIETIQKGIDRLKEYRTALISAAVTGQIDVRDSF